MNALEPHQYVFVGLGNPGPDYEMTRHNIGYLVIKAFARKQGWHFKEEKKFQSFVVKGRIGEKTVHLLLPTTYMNRSGEAVKSYIDFYKLDKQRLVIVVDDIALRFGQLRIKPQGSAGGHNGLKSIETYLGTHAYIRLRMGIGHPGENILADYVLDPFSQEELQHLMHFVDHGVEVLQRLLMEDVAKVMNVVNTIPSNEGSK